MQAEPVSGRIRVRRHPERGHYDEETLYRILDQTFLCHVGFVDDAHPVVIPTLYVRQGSALYLHGATGSRLSTVLRRGLPIAVTVTILDGIVLARSAFHHSVNYQSVVALGRAEEVTGATDKVVALHALLDGMVPGRWNAVRPPREDELAQTAVFRVPLTSASAKVRQGPSADDADDWLQPVWAGVIPLSLRCGDPIPNPDLAPGIPWPGYHIGRQPL
ncbi:MAG: pyridoxamine 5'-phosphate oxidase family protein [Thermaerobacter sp.]|nr:pyridoxamine 5'-phosphate oxidase family protein [Thermaerobacter sp.]